MANTNLPTLDVLNPIQPTKESKTEVLEQNVYDLIMRGTTWHEVRDKVLNDYWGIGIHYTEASYRNLVSRVKKRIREEWKEHSAQLREDLVARLMDVYRDSRANGDRATALNTLKYLGKISGQEEPTRLDVNINGAVEIDFNIGE